MSKTGTRLTIASLAVTAAFILAGSVVAFADTNESGQNQATGSVLQTGSGNDYIEAIDDLAAPPAVRRDVIRCGEGVDTVDADEIDEVAQDCENVSRSGSPVTDSQSSMQPRGFNCSITAQNPHKSENDSGDDVMVAKGRIACQTDDNSIYIGTELAKWRINGWIHLKGVSNNNNGHPRPAANTNLRWECPSEDDFWFKNHTHGVVRNNGNQKEYIATNVSDRKWRC